MKSYLALTWKELKAQKITAILILIAVIYDHDNGSRSVHWDITIYADGAGGESEWKPLCNLPSA